MKNNVCAYKISKLESDMITTNIALSYKIHNLVTDLDLEIQLDVGGKKLLTKKIAPNSRIMLIKAPGYLYHKDAVLSVHIPSGYEWILNSLTFSIEYDKCCMHYRNFDSNSVTI